MLQCSNPSEMMQFATSYHDLHHTMQISYLSNARQKEILESVIHVYEFGIHCISQQQRLRRDCAFNCSLARPLYSRIHKAFKYMMTKQKSSPLETLGSHGHTMFK